MAATLGPACWLPMWIQFFLLCIRAQRGADGLQVVPEQIAKAELLLRSEILFALEHAPARFLQQRLVTLLSHPARFGGKDLIQKALFILATI